MKDANHHRKNTQKKVLKAARQETRVRWKNSSSNSTRPKVASSKSI